MAKLLKICDQFKSRWSKTAKELKKARQQIDQLTEENIRLEKDLQYFKDKFLEKSNDYDKVNKELIDLRSKVKQFANVVNSSDLPMDKNNVMIKSKSVLEDEEKDENEKFRLHLYRLRRVNDENDDDRINENGENKNNKRIHLKTIAEEKEEEKAEQQYNEQIEIMNKTVVEKNFLAPSSSNSSDLTIDVSEVDEPLNNHCDNNNNGDIIKTMDKKLHLNDNIKLMKIDDEINNGYSLRRFAHLLHPSPPDCEQKNYLAKIPAIIGHHEHHWKLDRSTSHRMLICAICNNRIGFYSKYVTCDGCDERAHDYCVVHNHPSKRNFRTIMDFVQSSPVESSSSTTSSHVEPLVPTLLLKCCSEIEKRGIRLNNIYGHIQQPNSSIIQNLMLDLLYPKNGYNNQFSHIDIDSLCNIVIYFLGYLIDLGDPLIPEYLYDGLYNLLSNHSDDNLKIINWIICQLPSCNRDTLAFLLVHLRKVAKNQHYNNMSLEKLARIFAPKIFHPSFPTTMQEKTMMILLSISSDFWLQILSHDTPSSSKLINFLFFKKLNQFSFSGPTSALLNNSIEDKHVSFFQSPCSYKSVATSQSVYNTPIGGGRGGDDGVLTPTSANPKTRATTFKRFFWENLKF